MLPRERSTVVVGNEPRPEFSRLARARSAQRSDRARRRIGWPVRRPQPRHPAALLIDQHRRSFAADAVAQIGDQRAHLIWRGAIAREQNEAERIGVAKEAAFPGRERGFRHPEDRGQRLTA